VNGQRTAERHGHVVSLFDAFNRRSWDTFEREFSTITRAGFVLHLPRRDLAIGRDQYAARVREEVVADATLRYAVEAVRSAPWAGEPGSAAGAEWDVVVLTRYGRSGRHQVAIDVCLLASVVDGAWSEATEYQRSPRTV
jgi:hypothetical protein